MLFNSYGFIFIFLPVTLAAYFCLNRFGFEKAAKVSLVIASLFFYGYNKVDYLLVILISILMNYFFNRVILRFPSKSKIILLFGILFNLSLLGYFKYFDFLIENINAITGGSFSFLNLALPLGISFFTFQQISYLVDTAKGECIGHGFLDYVLFVTFFPQLVAGPIVSHDEMLPQFMNTDNKKINYANLCKGIQAFSIGLFKKVIIADHFGEIVNYGYSHVSGLNSFEALLTILAYTIQIYFDFSGYCDMASGIGFMFNIKLPQNFNSPYKATNIVEFWRRWHMTLTRFLTKYVYIPIGGNRRGEYRTYINIFIVFLLSGFWHGAGYTFILWGFLHGVANVLCRATEKQRKKLPAWIEWICTFVFINFTWVLFRSNSISQAEQLISRLFSGGFSMNAELTETLLMPAIINIPAHLIPLIWFIIICTVVTFMITLFAKNTDEIINARLLNAKNLIWTASLFLISVLSLSGVSTFLYFNF